LDEAWGTLVLGIVFGDHADWCLHKLLRFVGEQAGNFPRIGSYTGRFVLGSKEISICKKETTESKYLLLSEESRR